MRVVTIASGKGGVGKSAVSLTSPSPWPRGAIESGSLTPTCTAPTSP